MKHESQSSLQTRRSFLAGSTLGMAGAIASTEAFLQHAGANDREKKKTFEHAGLENQIGVTTSSFSGHLVHSARKGKFTLLDLPQIMRNELGMRVIDLNTASLASDKPAYLDQVRNAADKHDCVLTNLKLNQRGLDMNSLDKSTREKALNAYKKSIDVAAKLGLRWARPLPLKTRPDMKIHIASYQELADYAAKRNIQMLVENFGWMQSDPESITRLVKAIGRHVAACPDTGNWNSNQLRIAGLISSFPLAVTCDFKARSLTATGEHPLYDLEECFRIGWDRGFKGPWCLEHANKDRESLFRELRFLHAQLTRWMKMPARN